MHGASEHVRFLSCDYHPFIYNLNIQWRIQDFPEEGAPTPKSAIILPFFLAKNCMKMKELGPGGVRVPGTPR